jgi:integrase
MISLQFYTSTRPSEIWSLKVKEINHKHRTIEKENHKTQWATGTMKVIPLSDIAYQLVMRYAQNKKPNDYVFSPIQSENERHVIIRTNRKSKITPSQKLRYLNNLKKQSRISGHFKQDTYQRSITYAIKRANKLLPPDQQIPHWIPCQIRYSAITNNVENYGIDVARAVAGQQTIEITQTYNHADYRIARAIADKQQDIFSEIISVIPPRKKE